MPNGPREDVLWPVQVTPKYRLPVDGVPLPIQEQQDRADRSLQSGPHRDRVAKQT